MKIAILFVGTVHDDGFNASALAGVEAARARDLATIEVIAGVPYDEAAIDVALARAAETADGVVFVGGQGNRAMPALARAHPGKRFAIIQGDKRAANLSSYDVRQEESAFLAGCLAARMTSTGCVGHLSGHRVVPGLKGRAAFAAGVRQAAPDVALLTGFCGSQDDRSIAHEWAAAEIAAGADVIFTMLNAARPGATEACRAAGVLQIGNALDWTRIDPEVFVASAVARIDRGVERAIEDMASGAPLNVVHELGLREGPYTGLALRSDVAEETRAEIAQIRAAIRAGRIEIPTGYEGSEFTPEEATCGSSG